MKRALDFTAAGLGLLVLSPVLLLVALVIKLTDGGPVFFRQERVGRGGRPFRMWKFRSMRVDNAGAKITVSGDSRITPIGRRLRASKLDELPQLWNVVRGDMSLVGPRPEVEEYVKLYTPEQRRVLDARPGITDPASFAFYDESALLARVADPHRYYVEHLMPEKIRINLEYADRRSMAGDLYLIVATVAKPLVKLDVFGHLGLRAPEGLA